MMHVDPVTRVRMLREFHRVSRRWVIIDYRHCYSFRYVLTHTFGRLGIGRPPLSRVSRKELEKEFADAGFAIRNVIRVSAPLLSDKWMSPGRAGLRPYSSRRNSAAGVSRPVTYSRVERKPVLEAAIVHQFERYLERTPASTPRARADRA